MITALIFLIVDSRSDRLFSRRAFGVRAAVTIASTAIVIWASVEIYSLRSAMEIPEWYNDLGSTPNSYAQLVSMTLLASTAIPVLKACHGKHPPSMPIRSCD